MHIKRFEADTMNQALLQIKREFGPDAVILSARSIKKGLLGSLKRARVEVTAATDHVAEDARMGFFLPQENTLEKDSVYLKAGTAGCHRNSGGQSYYSRYERAPEPATGGADRKSTFTPSDAPAQDSPLKEHLLRQGVDSRYASEFAREIDLFEVETNDPGLQKRICAQLALMGLCCEKIKIKSQASSVVALIGPAGVGKTTTTAKLAALAGRRLGVAQVGVIAIDNSTNGAGRQILPYTALAGIDARVVSTPRAFAAALSDYRKMPLVLVDTAGVNPAKQEQVAHLRKFFESGRRSPEVHLLLSAGCKEGDMLKMAAGFEPLAYSRLLFTKLDETVTLGNLLNVMIRTRTPVSYLADGQRIPEDLHIASHEILVGRILKHAPPSGYHAAEPPPAAGPGSMRAVRRRR